MINPVNTYQTREGIFFYNYSCQVFQAVSGEILIWSWVGAILERCQNLFRIYSWPSVECVQSRHTLLKSTPLPPALTLYTPNPGSVRVFLLEVGGWLSLAGLEALSPFLVLVELLVAPASSLVSLAALAQLLPPLLQASLSVLVSIAVGEQSDSGAAGIRASDLGSAEGAERAKGSRVEGLSAASAFERMSSWTMSFRPTL